MADLPERVEIAEEGPREGFQIEPGPIPTADKVALVDALSATGLRHIQVCSFVNPKLVPGWADAESETEPVIASRSRKVSARLRPFPLNQSAA